MDCFVILRIPRNDGISEKNGFASFFILDCFVAMLLAMTEYGNKLLPASQACARNDGERRDCCAGFVSLQ
jgi:hypothetical protein